MNDHAILLPSWLKRWLLCGVAITMSLWAGALPAGTLEIRVVDVAGEQLSCRIHLRDADGKPRHPGNLPFFRDHFVCPGLASLELEAAKYDYEIEHGPEYEPATGSVEVSSGTEQVRVTLKRIADMAARGWWSGELHVHRDVEEMPLHLRAEDLHVAPVITWWNGRDQWRDRALPERTLVTVDGNRYYDVMGGEDEREGGALMFFGLQKPLPLPGNKGRFPEYPSPMKFVELAREHEGVWIDVEKPFWWDMPVWLAGGQVDSIGLANNHMCRSSMYETEAWGKPRDAKRLPPPRGDGFWSQEVYYHVLNCGLRVPPSAGSASGVLPNPVGYNRVYVYTGAEFSYDAWWKGLEHGRSFVSNGPLLMCRANDQLPGHVFQSDGPLEIDLNVEVVSNDRVPDLEIVKNGDVVQRVPLEGSAESHAAARLHFDKSGWFLVRAITDIRTTFRFASTAPYYVEIGQVKHRISRRSARFFVDWVNERRERVASKLKDPAKLREVLRYHDQAQAYWQDVMKRANAD